jgi:hypothetical protein
VRRTGIAARYSLALPLVQDAVRKLRQPDELHADPDLNA